MAIEGPTYPNKKDNDSSKDMKPFVEKNNTKQKIDTLITKMQDFPSATPEQIPHVSHLIQKRIRGYDTYTQEMLDKFSTTRLRSATEGEEKKQDLFVALDDGNIVGTVSQIHKKVPRISDPTKLKDMRNVLLALFTDHGKTEEEKVRRKGLGTKLTQFIERKAKDAGHDYLIIPARPEAIGFYIQLGYNLKEPADELTEKEVTRYNELKQKVAHGEIDKRDKEMVEYYLLKAKMEPITEQEIKEYEDTEDMKLIHFKNAVRMWKKLD